MAWNGGVNFNLKMNLVEYRINAYLVESIAEIARFLTVKIMLLQLLLLLLLLVVVVVVLSSSSSSSFVDE